MISNIMQIQSIVIGKRGENNAVVHDFDLSEFVTKWGSGTATLLHKRPNDTRPYLVSGAVQDSTANALTWTVSSADTAQAGEGELEIRWTITGGLAKSARFKTIITDSLVDETTEQPGAVVYMGDGSQITKNKNDILQIKEDLSDLDDRVEALEDGSGGGSGSSGTSGTGWTSAQITLLETVLQNLAYSSASAGQTAAASLISSLRGNSGGSSGSGGSSSGGTDTPTAITATMSGATIVTNATAAAIVGTALVLS